jgi:hypothetical protein
MSTEEKEINAMVVRALFANVQRYIYVAEVWYVEDKKDEEANDEAPPREHPDRKEAILFMAEDRMSGGVFGIRFIDRTGKRPKLKPLEVDRPTAIGGRLVSMLTPMNGTQVRQ